MLQPQELLCCWYLPEQWGGIQVGAVQQQVIWNAIEAEAEAETVSVSLQLVPLQSGGIQVGASTALPEEYPLAVTVMGTLAVVASILKAVY